MTIVQVAIPVPLRQLFSYRLPESLTLEKNAVGRRVLVPFSGRQVIGVIVDVVDQSDIAYDKLKTVISIPADEFPLPKQIVKLITLTANYYHHPVGEVYHLALPAALRKIDREPIPPIERWRVNPNVSTATIDNLATRAPKQFDLYQHIQAQQSLLTHHGISLGDAVPARRNQGSGRYLPAIRITTRLLVKYPKSSG